MALGICTGLWVWRISVYSYSGGYWLGILYDWHRPLFGELKKNL